MRRLKALHFGAALGTACLMVAAGAVARDAESIAATANTLDAPMSLEQALALPDLRPRIEFDSPGSSSQRQANSIVHGGWQYQMRYVRTNGDWRFDSYTVSRMDQPQDSGGDKGIGKKSVVGAKPAIVGATIGGGGADQIPDGPLPPPANTNPYMPLNPPPDPNDPQMSQHTVCDFGGGSYDLHVEYQWVPEHTVTNRDGSTTVIPGQWVLKTYTVSISYSECH